MVRSINNDVPEYLSVIVAFISFAVSLASFLVNDVRDKDKMAIEAIEKFRKNVKPNIRRVNNSMERQFPEIDNASALSVMAKRRYQDTMMLANNSYTLIKLISSVNSWAIYVNYKIAKKRIVKKILYSSLKDLYIRNVDIIYLIDYGMRNYNIDVTEYHKLMEYITDKKFREDVR